MLEANDFKFMEQTHRHAFIFHSCVAVGIFLIGCGPANVDTNVSTPVYDTIREFYPDGNPSVNSARLNGKLSGETVWFGRNNEQVVANYYRGELKGSRIFYDSLHRIKQFEFYNLLNELSYVAIYETSGLIKETRGCSIAGIEVINPSLDSLVFAVEIATPIGCSSTLKINPTAEQYVENEDSSLVRISFNGIHWDVHDDIQIVHVIRCGTTDTDSCLRIYKAHELIARAVTALNSAAPSQRSAVDARP